MTADDIALVEHAVEGWTRSAAAVRAAARGRQHVVSRHPGRRAPTEVEGTKADEIAVALEDDIVRAGSSPARSCDRSSFECFGVSRMPIREALRRLSARACVSFMPNRGVRVRTLSREELREAFLVRSEPEGLATELAVPG